MLTKAIEKIYRSKVYARADGDEAVFYFSKDNFEGLNAENFFFSSSLGHKMSGCFYSYEGFDEKRLIIFEHGMGSGHTGYMKEIEMLCREGYRVFSYDHTGCMNSEGETTNGFAQSLRDLDDAIKALKSDSRYKDLSLSVVGHSWGGFSSLNISALHPEIEKIVAMAGFVSVERIVGGFFSGILSPFGKKIMETEKASNPEYVKYDALETLKSTESEVLVIHSLDDKTVSAEKNFKVLQDGLKDKENISFLSLDGKNHNPNYTEDAVKYKDNFFAEYTKALKKKKLVTSEAKKAFRESYDWERMTAQDEKVWAEIFDFLRR